MKSVGIICEYDPFHNGHLRQIECARANGAGTVVCVMSGNTTQRGGFACADKYVRAEAALLSGADLVLELPYPYSSASAEYFAAAGVKILDSLGVDELNFGSECGDIDVLFDVAKFTASEEYLNIYRKLLDENKEIGSAEAYSEAYFRLTGREMPTMPNDTLGIAYCRAAIEINASLKLTTVKREGAGFSDTEICENALPSATAIRRMFSTGEFERAFLFMPKASAECFGRALDDGRFPTDMSRISHAVLAWFRLADPESLDSVAEASGGVGRRLVSAAKKATGLDEMLSLAATKRYTDARLRRAALYAMTGVTQEDLKADPAYTTLLAANKRGRALLNKKTNNELKIVTKPADAPFCRQNELSSKADAIYTLTFEKALPSDEFLRKKPKISEND